MKRLLVFADLHGSHAAWLTVRALMSEGDGLAVAGDLFDTRYGSYGNPDFKPREIRSALERVSFPFYYAYGNCDVESFFPGFSGDATFEAFGRSLYLHHGHRPVPQNSKADIIIQGHTHLCGLKASGERIHMNPGSIVLPRNNLPTYGIIDAAGASIIRLKTGEPLTRIDF